MKVNLTSVNSPRRLCGRESELRILSHAVDAVSGGFGRAVFLTGEPGIGKTRLAHEAILLARSRRFRVLEGRAFPLDGRVAYSPFLSALGPFLRHLDPVDLSRLTRGLTDLGRLFSGIHFNLPEPLSDPSLEKTRLFDAVSLLLERLTDESPILLYLDDLHWADPASIELLQYLSHGLNSQPLFLLGTYRSEDVDSARGLRSLLSSLRRSGLSNEIEVGRLDHTATAQMVSEILNSIAPPELISFIETRSGGTPLFVEELIGGLIDSGHLTHGDDGWKLDSQIPGVLPPSIRDLIHERLIRLSDTDRQIVDLIAVSGEAAVHRVLQSASGLDEEILLESVHRLSTIGLVMEEVAGQDVLYSLSHPLIQDVAYGDLPEMLRRRYHAAFASASDSINSNDLDYRAYHFRLAGRSVDPDRALDVLVAAGDRAYELYANDQAARHFTAALDLIRQGRRSDLLPYLLERLGDSWERAGEIAAAISVWQEALIEYERAGDAQVSAELHRKLALAEWDRGRFADARVHLESGLNALAETEPSSSLADLLHTQHVILGRSGEFETILTVTERLADLAEQLGSAKVRAEAHLARFGWYVGHWEFDDAHKEGLLGLEAAEQSGDSLLTLRAHDMLGHLMLSIGDHESLRSHSIESLRLAKRIASRTLEPYPRIRLVMADMLAGKWHEAQLASLSVVGMARRIGFRRAIAGGSSIAAFVHTRLGDLGTSHDLIDDAYEAYGHRRKIDQHIFGQVLLAQLELALERERVDEIKVVLEITRDVTQESGFQVPILEAAVGTAYVVVGDFNLAEEMAERLDRKAPSGNVFLPAHAARIEALKHRALCHRQAALAYFEQAIAGFAAAGTPFEEARARLEWASLLVDDNPISARDGVERSLDVFERIGARLYVNRSLDLLTRLGVQRRRRTSSTSTSRLSSRELEVARFVAEGMTNAEIARQLFISPRTVTTHLDRIYVRLDIHSRAELVRYLAESDLLLAPDDAS